ncbi:hypothetical protein FRC18_002329 [Serendipita sp. 400]|nr:hypothetical protein FRC18_002329 [Serendipita sp. 400]
MKAVAAGTKSASDGAVLRNQGHHFLLSPRLFVRPGALYDTLQFSPTSFTTCAFPLFPFLFCFLPWLHWQLRLLSQVRTGLRLAHNC